MQTTDAESILRQLLELFIDDESIDQILEVLGDVIVTSVSAAPPAFPLIDSGIIYEYDYGLRLDEVTVDFDADLEVNLPPNIARTHVDHLGGRIVYDDGDRTTIRLSLVRLRCIAQVRSELDVVEITELSISVDEE